MSSRAVRILAEQWAQALTTPYYRTINEEQNPSDPVWMTIEFDTYGYDKTTFCDTWAETGAITLIWIGPAGIGFDSLLAQAEADAEVFMSQSDPTRKLILVGRSAPDELSGPDVPFYEVAISFTYEFRP